MDEDVVLTREFTEAVCDALWVSGGIPLSAMKVSGSGTFSELAVIELAHWTAKPQPPEPPDV